MPKIIGGRGQGRLAPRGEEMLLRLLEKSLGKWRDLS